MDIHIKGITLP